MKSVECGLQNEKKKNTGVVILAGMLAVFLHGVVFSVPAYLLYSKSKLKTQNSKVEQTQNTIQVELAVLPAIKQEGNESIIKEEEGKKPENAQETGLAGQAEKQGSTEAEKEMLTYQDIIKQKIQQSRKYPADARQKGIEGAVEMAFTIMKQGALKNVDITGASGYMPLDEEAVATIKRASPFPEIPAGFGGQELTMKVKLIFDIE